MIKSSSMPLKYKIISDLKMAYVRGAGKVTSDEIMTEGARMFAENEWINGFNILCDYREITEFGVKTEDMGKIVSQDKNNEFLFDQSKCAIVAGSNLVFGVSRMWKTLSEDNKIETMVFRNIEDSLRWLGMDELVFQSIKELP